MNFFKVQAADVWWAMLPAERKVQIHRWIEPETLSHPTPGQYEIPGIGDDPEPDSDVSERK